jgi:hypothetical protein
MDKNRICAAFEKMIPVSFDSQLIKPCLIYEQIIKSLTNVIIIFGDTEFLLFLRINLWQFLMTGKVWVMNSHCDITLIRRHFMLDSFNAPLVFAHHHGDISGFTKYIQTVNLSKYMEDFYLAMLWAVLFNCSLSESDCVPMENCSYNASLEWLPGHLLDMNLSEESYNIYNAVYAMSLSLHEMFLHQIEVESIGNGKEMVGVFPFTGNVFHIG